MRNMSVRQLEVFCETAAAGHLTRAASRLNMTQAAASMALSAFEREAGGPVFTRVGRGLRLNDRGARLLPAASAVLAAYDGFASLCGESGPLSGQVRVGASTTVANYCLPELFGRFIAENPGVHVSLRVGNTEEMAQALREGELDFAVVEGEVSGGGIERVDWLRDELAVLFPPSHRLAGRKTVRLKELARERWIMREKGSGTLSTLQSVLSASGLKFEQVQEIGHTEAIKRAVEAGMGIGCLSSRAVALEAKTGRLAAVRLSPPLLRWFRILKYRGRYMSRQSDALLRWLRGHTPVTKMR